MLRDKLLEIKERKGEQWITIEDLPEELKYTPNVYGAGKEIHYRKIQGILFDYNLTSRKDVVNETTKRKAETQFKIGDKKVRLGKWERFVELAKPNENGYSEEVSRAQFEEIGLTLGNGGDFSRAENTLAKMFKMNIIKDRTPGNSIDVIQLNGYNEDIPFNQTIAYSIREILTTQNCVMLGYNGDSTNTKIEIDHKDGRKENLRVSDPSTQKLDDFQPLCKAANDVKRQICKNCKATDKRWDARNIEGNPYSFYEGDENYTEEQGCVGCYQYDPVEYRIRSVQKVSQESIDTVMSKLYPNYKTKSDK